LENLIYQQRILQLSSTRDVHISEAAGSICCALSLLQQFFSFLESFAEMAGFSQVSYNKRGRDESWNGGLDLPDAKRTNSGTLMHDSDLMALLEKIDNMDDNNSNPETVNGLEDERLNGVIKSLEDEIGLKGQAGVDELGSTEMVSIKQGELTDGNSEATSTSVSDIGDLHSEAGNLTYYDDVRAELGFFVDHTADELGIIMSHIDGDSMANIMYSDAVHGYVETSEVFYGSLWEDDIWLLNEHPVVQKDFELPQQEVGLVVSGSEFDEVGNDIRAIHRLSANEEKV